MKAAISNIALPPYNHENELSALSGIGFDGLEVAVSRVWDNTNKITFFQTENYRRQVEKAGLKILGLHSLFFDQPDLGLFRENGVRRKTLNFLTYLSKICVDLGGKTLVFGSPPARKRNDLSVEEADKQTVSFFNDLSRDIESHGTCFMLEALGKKETDYIHSSRHALRISKTVDRDQLKCHLDAKALADADEGCIEVFQEISSRLVHFHANDPGLGILGKTLEVNHSLFGELLRKINYTGYVSIEQRMLDSENPLVPIQKSYAFLKESYL